MQLTQNCLFSSLFKHIVLMKFTWVPVMKPMIHSCIFRGRLTWLLGLGEFGQNLSRALPGAVGHVFVSNVLLEQLRSFHWHLRTMSIHVAARKGTGYAFWTSYLGRVGICPSLDIFRVKKQDWENTNAFLTHASSSRLQTNSSTSIVFLNTARSDLFLRVRKFTIVAL